MPTNDITAADNVDTENRDLRRVGDVGAYRLSADDVHTVTITGKYLHPTNMLYVVSDP